MGPFSSSASWFIFDEIKGGKRSEKSPSFRKLLNSSRTDRQRREAFCMSTEKCQMSEDVSPLKRPEWDPSVLNWDCSFVLSLLTGFSKHLSSLFHLCGLQISSDAQVYIEKLIFPQLQRGKIFALLVYNLQIHTLYFCNCFMNYTLWIVFLPTIHIWFVITFQFLEIYVFTELSWVFRLQDSVFCFQIQWVFETIFHRSINIPTETCLFSASEIARLLGNDMCCNEWCGTVPAPQNFHLPVWFDQLQWFTRVQFGRQFRV